MNFSNPFLTLLIYMHSKHVCLLSFIHLPDSLYQEVECARTCAGLVEEISNDLQVVLSKWTTEF